MPKSEKRNSISIDVDLASLAATVDIRNAGEAAEVDLALILRSRGNTVDATGGKYKIPWHHLRRVLIAVFSVCTQYEIAVESDKYAQELIDSFAKDYRAFASREEFLTVGSDELRQLLRDTGFNRDLTSFQDRDVRALLAMRHGANFSVPGAGKTTSLLAMYRVLRSHGLVDRLVVVAPINAFISWEEEWSDIFGKDTASNIRRLSVSDLENYSQIAGANAELFLVNYEKLRRHSSGLVPFFRGHKIHFVLDEAHRIKAGERNLSYQEIVRLGDLAVRRDILTGTPMPQSPLDLDPQFEFLWTQSVLREPIPTENDELIAQANLAIEGRFARTTKGELGLPEPIFKFSNVSMGPVQSELYSLLKSETARRLAGLDFGDRELLRGLQRSIVRLMQAATNPMLLGSDDEYDAELVELTSGSRIAEVISEFARFEKPAKVEFLRQRVADLLRTGPDTKVVIWSYFVRNIRLLESLLKEFRPLSIYGAVPSGSDEDETKREGILKKFKTDKDSRVLIANPQACGEGISLHKVCHYALYLDRSFNAAHFLQSVDRIHRVGLPSGVETTIEIISAPNTIDEVINTRLVQKAAAMGAVLNDAHLLQLAYDPADIADQDESGLDRQDLDAITEHITTQ